MIKVTREAKGGRPYKLTDEEVDQVIALYNEGIAVAKIAERYSVSAQTIRRYIRIRRNSDA